MPLSPKEKKESRIYFNNTLNHSFAFKCLLHISDSIQYYILRALFVYFYILKSENNLMKFSLLRDGFYFLFIARFNFMIQFMTNCSKIGDRTPLVTNETANIVFNPFISFSLRIYLK